MSFSEQQQLWCEASAATAWEGDMVISDAQDDLRRAYVGGGPGVMISGLVWLAATLTLHAHGIADAFAVLFFGGMLIFPGAKLVSRTVFRRENESSNNPFGMTGLESTIAMMGGLFAAWLFLSSTPELVFPLAAIAVGTHYFVFKTAYGDRLFWLLGGIVTAIGFGDIFITHMRGLTALLVTISELAFGLTLTFREMRSSKVISIAMNSR
jgi:hypothetical protein